MNDDREMNFLPDFVGLLNSYFKPTNQTQDAAHQLSLLKQGQAGYSSDTPSDHLHLIEKL